MWLLLGIRELGLEGIGRWSFKHWEDWEGVSWMGDLDMMYENDTKV